MKNLIVNDEFDNIYESVESIYIEKNAIEKEKDNRILKVKKYSEKYKDNTKGIKNIFFDKGVCRKSIRYRL